MKKARRCGGLWLALCLALVSSGAALNVSFQALESVDYGSYRTFDVRFETSARDQEIRDFIYREAAGQLLSRGLGHARQQPDLLVVIHAQQVGNSVLGMMQIDLVDARTEAPFWRANGSETLALDKPKKLRRQIKKLISEMFKHVPVSRR
jgi:hypothetical protein